LCTVEDQEEREKGETRTLTGLIWERRGGGARAVTLFL
jgi:hypothetical protein